MNRLLLIILIGLFVISSSLPLVQATQYSVTNTINVGNSPVAVAFDSANNRMYVTNSADNNVSVIDTSSNTVTTTISVGTNPQSIAFDSTNNRMYVGNINSNDVSVISTSSNTVTTTISVGTNPYGVAFDSANNRMYVANYGSNNVSVIDTSSNTVTTTISVGTNPYGIAFDSANNRMYVANHGSDNVSVISTSSNTVTTTISVGAKPNGVAFDSTNNRIYVSNLNGNSVSVISTSSNTVTTTISVGNSPYGIAFDSTNKKIYVDNNVGHSVSVIDTSSNTVTTTISVDNTTNGIAFDSKNIRMYTTSYNGNKVYVIDAAAAASASSTSGAGRGSARHAYTPPIIGKDSGGRQIVKDGFVYNGLATDVGYYYTHYPLIHIQIGKPNIAEFKIYEDSGSSNIIHFELDFGLAKEQTTSLSKARIEWDKSWDGKEKTTVYDPENVLQDVSIESDSVKCSDDFNQMCLLLKINHTFRAPLEFDIVGTNMWDEKRNALQEYFNDGIHIDGKSLNPPIEHDGIYKGKIFHLIELDKKTALDEYGNRWSLDHEIWVKDYVTQKITDRDWKVMKRIHSEFDSMKQEQIRLAKSTLFNICQHCIDKNFAEINDTYTINMIGKSSKLQDPQVIENLKKESSKASYFLEQYLQKIYPDKIDD